MKNLDNPTKNEHPAEPETNHPARSLTSRTVSSYFWVLGGAGTRSLLKILVLAILARLLAPVDFGLVGAAMTVVALADIFGQIGIAPAIVQRKDLRGAHINTGWTLTLVMGVLVGGAIYGLAPYIADLFRMETLGPVIRAFAFVFPIRSIGIVAEALLQRHMRFRNIAVIELTSYLIGYALVAIILARAGFGVWSLVYGQLAQTFIASVGLVMSAKHPLKLSIERSALRQLMRFSVGATLAHCGSYVALNADFFVVGRWLGAAALGFYSRAYYFLMQPTSFIGSLGDRVLFPALSSIQSDQDRTLKVYYLSVSLIFLITAPLAAFLFVLAPEIIQLLLGGKWSAVVFPFQCLVVSLPFRTAYKMTGTLLRAQGLVGSLAAWQWLYAALVIGAAWIGQFHGLSGVAIGVSLAITLSFWIGTAIVAVRCAVSTRVVLIAFLKYGLVSLAFGVGLFYVKQLHPFSDLSPVVLVALVGLIAAIVALVIWVMFPRFFGDEGTWIRSMIGANLKFSWIFRAHH